MIWVLTIVVYDLLICSSKNQRDILMTCMATKKLNQLKHPIDSFPFEVLCDGAWWFVECMKVKDGAITTCFEHMGLRAEEIVPLAHLRMRSRKATVADCIRFLRPGVDICVHSTYPSGINSSEESPQAAWVDAKICSIERKPHEFRCSCLFYLSFNGAHKEVQEVKLDDIAILQKLDKKHCEDEFYRWSSSTDCASAFEAKLRGKFSCDISWMLAASCVKGLEFKVRSVQNKMFYQVVGGYQNKCRFGTDKSTKAINFNTDENGVMKPYLKPFVTEISVLDEKIVTGSFVNLVEDELHNLLPCDLMELRRSKRRYVQPDRFVAGEGGFMERKKKKKDVERSSPIWCEVDNECLDHMSEHKNQVEYSAHGSKDCTNGEFKAPSEFLWREVKTIQDDAKLDLFQIVEFQENGKDTIRREKQIQCSNHFSMDESKEICTSKKYVRGEFYEKSDQKLGTSPSHRVRNDSTESQRKENSWGQSAVKKRFKEIGLIKKHAIRRRLNLSKRKVYDGERLTIRKFITRDEYKDMIERCMKSIASEVEKPEPTTLSQCESMPFNQRGAFSPTPLINEEEEKSELDDLWKEMETALNSQYLEESQKNDGECSNDDDKQSCQHEPILDEQIGEVCRLCHTVLLEIRYVLPPLVESTRRGRYREQYDYDQSKRFDNSELDLIHEPDSSGDNSTHEEHDSVWTLVPNLQEKMHTHQKKAFEFMWRNIAGSLKPADMKSTSERMGGCVISHSPGAGKTFLTISFVTSCLKLFPRKRPLILAPKTTLYTWYKEFLKWDVPIPVHQIHARRNYRRQCQNQRFVQSPGDFKPNRDVLHVVDCLEKLQKWHEGPSVLLMSYPSFLSIMRGNSKFEHWNYMAKIIQSSPGLLILDEGHNPRSTTSMLRKTLMKVKTDHRILLSGTLFQNNFEEYFNTLSLARPLFISEVLGKLAKSTSRKRGQEKMTRRLKEKIARKIFMDKVAQRISSRVEQDRMQGLHMLKKLTNHFIDVYEGGAAEVLPGLETYKLLIKPTLMQQEFLAKLKQQDSVKRYSLELELLVTFVSIHPWLVKTLRYADKIYTPDELDKIEKHKLDVKLGSKVQFVVNLVGRCSINREKVLIFCHNIEPIKLFVAIFENTFGWSEGEQVLVLNGDQELYDRVKVIDKFEDRNGSSQVLLGSIASCAEGISLTAASRVVLLDSEWNPSKTKQAVGRAFRPGQEKMVYVYQLLASGTMELDKHGKNTWKQKVSRMIFVGPDSENSSCRQVEDIDDEVLRAIVEADQGKSFHMITRDEKPSNGSPEVKEGPLLLLQSLN